MGTFILAVMVTVIAQFVIKPGKRHLVRWGAGLAWVLIVTILANVICFGPMYNNLAPIINGGGSVSPESAAASELVIEKVGNEGNIDVLTFLKNAGFEVNQELIDMYTDYSDSRTLPGVGVGFTDWSLPESPADRYTDELMDNAKAFSDTAVIVLARSGGEGQDLPTDMSKVIDGTVNDVQKRTQKNAVPSARSRSMERRGKRVKIFCWLVGGGGGGCRNGGVWVRDLPVWENRLQIAKFQGPRISLSEGLECVENTGLTGKIAFSPHELGAEGGI